MMGDIEGTSSDEEATLENLRMWLETESTVAPKDLSERLEGVLKLVTYHRNKEYPVGGFASFFLSFINELDKNNALEILQDGDV